MTTTAGPVAQRYLRSLESALGGIRESERGEIISEIADHLADAVAAGRPLEEVLAALGPADALARAYMTELALNPRDRTVGPFDRFLVLVGLAAVTSLPSFVVCVTLGSIAVALLAAGIGVFAGGIAGYLRPDLVPDLTVAPWVCLLGGPVIFAAGAAAAAGLYYYVRFMTRIATATFRRVRGASF